MNCEIVLISVFQSAVGTDSNQIEARLSVDGLVRNFNEKVNIVIELKRDVAVFHIE